MKIPLSNMPAPRLDKRVRIGHVYAHETIVPVVVSQDSVGLTIKLNVGHHDLGELLADISDILTEDMVDRLCKKEVVYI